ncbi:hypothetical protein LCGC14_2742530 [marine sediment metagenome]|uniref:Uncharacterized protein n=1 Tax=marine sediment metagenome TaxID=412755 RepID=A0A0F9BVS2_9ZZZZ
MELTRAIELLNTVDSRDITPASHDFRTAIKLGTEALQHISKQRRFNLAFSDDLLPGETDPDIAPPGDLPHPGTLPVLDSN